MRVLVSDEDVHHPCGVVGVFGAQQAQRTLWSYIMSFSRITCLCTHPHPHRADDAPRRKLPRLRPSAAVPSCNTSGTSMMLLQLRHRLPRTGNVLLHANKH